MLDLTWFHLSPQSRRRRTSPPARRPNEAARTFAIRVGPEGSQRFVASLGKIDSEAGAQLSSYGGSLRCVATVVLPEAVHVVAVGRRSTIAEVAAALRRRLEDVELAARLLAADDPGSGDGVLRLAAPPLRCSILETAGLSRSASTILAFPQARGLVGRDGTWPWAHAG